MVTEFGWMMSGAFQSSPESAFWLPRSFKAQVTYTYYNSSSMLSARLLGNSSHRPLGIA